MVPRDNIEISSESIIEANILDKFFAACKASIKFSKKIRLKLNKVQEKVHKTNGNSKRAANIKNQNICL